MQCNKIKTNSQNLQLLQFLIYSSESPIFSTIQLFLLISSNCIKIPHHILICNTKTEDIYEDKICETYAKKC